MTEQQFKLATELVLSATSETLTKLSLKLNLNFLTDEQRLAIELTSGVVLDWESWFVEYEKKVEKLFSIAITSPGKPPVVIGAAVYSYDINNGVVSIHMLEHFANVIKHTDLNDRMGFIAFTMACTFAKTVDAKKIRIANPLKSVYDYYTHWGFSMDNKDSCFYCERDSLLDKLGILSREYNGTHDYEYIDD